MTTPNDALDFYPTPDSLAFDMVFSLREVKSGFTTYPKPILEPSAGDGALARQVHALAFNVHHDHKTGVPCPVHAFHEGGIVTHPAFRAGAHRYI